MRSTFTLIRSRLDLLRRFDEDREVFGASEHDYVLEPVWSIERLEQFESEIGATLPEDLRAFLLDVGGGGAGPHYGLAVPNAQTIVPEARLDEPFPLDDVWEGGDTLLDETSVYDGCLFLADQGCGYFDFLVLSGPRAGEVWSDYTEAEGPIGPSAASFLDWYTLWLRDAIVSMLCNRAWDLAMRAPSSLTSLGDAVAELEARLEEDPEAPGRWRALGYVRLGEGDYDEAEAAFATAARHGEKEPQARLSLDLARLHVARESFEDAFAAIENGLAQSDLWGSTERELRALKLEIFDRLDRPDDAMTALSDLVHGAVSTRAYHFEKAYRHLVRQEFEQAWSVLDHAARNRVGPANVRMTATLDDIYLAFVDWLSDRGEPELAELALDAAP